MKILLAMLALGGTVYGATVLLPIFSDDLGEDINPNDALVAAAVDAAERITEQALEAGAAVEVTPQLVADVNDHFREACDLLNVMHANLGLDFEFTEGVVENGRWRVEPRCEPIER